MPRTKRVKKLPKSDRSEIEMALKKLSETEASILHEIDMEDRRLADLIADHDVMMEFMQRRSLKYKDICIKDMDAFDVSCLLSTMASTKKHDRSKIKRSISDSAINDTCGGKPSTSSKSSTLSSDSGHHSTSSNSSRSILRNATQRSGSVNRTASTKSVFKSTAIKRRSRSETRIGKGGLPLEFGLTKSAMRTPLGQRTQIMTPITPKMKDINTQPAVLRRPKQNEIAVSLQGSPLMVHPIMADGINANIPLSDGRVLALQPQNMRYSEIADISLGQESLNELKLLRDNLTKLCENYKHSKYNK